MSDPTFIDAAGVADLLGLPDADAFLRRRLDMEDNMGFPLSLPYWRRPLKYRRDQVIAWRDRQGLPKSEAEAQAEAIRAGIRTGKVALLDMARSA